jgi:uncharacterized protein (TIGR02466 family)
MTQVFELFPTPVMRVERIINDAEVAALRARLLASAATPNQRSDEASHTHILSPADDPFLTELAQRINPQLEQFGALLFGERLRWGIKEMWGNVLQTGGRQSVHTHANCFISGVVYLTEPDASAQTVFIRSMGGRDYVFTNTHEGASVGPFNADKWIGPPPTPGDLVLFPSYLLHEVPVNRGALRVTLAFNAVPHRLDAWGYAVSFSA